ncbi:4a-hydroxytetrahydrobiopterin dehydratase [Sciscionella sediminilitoris]|uniref:4a-hydroxytetrahydrobiopterin dehydratase n=1 Tax=Sciscionella sediminilitoris TaxID=1445613 RepID=UPI0004DF9573|nr:4a-hydroxytetrahydrobiopterin dehydratase [Sciscionella sp. SE31]
MTALLTEQQISDALGELPEWHREGEAITRSAKLPSFPDAITAVDRIAEIAERADHHPDIDIRWRTLTFTCATHSEGGLTEKDTRLATEIDKVLASFG